MGAWAWLDDGGATERPSPSVAFTESTLAPGASLPRTRTIATVPLQR